MAHFIILSIMALSLLTAGLSFRTIIAEWRNANRQAYGTMNFDASAHRGSSKLSLISNIIICLVSVVLLGSSVMIYQLIRFPVL